MTITDVLPDALVTTEAAGITSALGTVWAIISTRMLVPGLSRSVWFAACTHTSTVVLEGSRAGLITVILPGI